jgi:hypothetical protein
MYIHPPEPEATAAHDPTSVTFTTPENRHGRPSGAVKLRETPKATAEKRV